jgi:hypothetical protein
MDPPVGERGYRDAAGTQELPAPQSVLFHCFSPLGIALVFISRKLFNTFSTAATSLSSDVADLADCHRRFTGALA